MTSPALQRLQIALAEAAQEIGLPEPDPERVAFVLRGRPDPLVIPCASRIVPMKPSEDKVLAVLRAASAPLMLKEIRTVCKLGQSTIASAVAELQRRHVIRHIPDEGYEIIEEG